jgi:uncharacterized C2H2 Zn-finger protein
MQLLFHCPRTGQRFNSERWSVQGSMRVVRRNDRRTLEGRVLVDCPVCGEVHSYDPDELSCPLHPNGSRIEE